MAEVVPNGSQSYNIPKLTFKAYIGFAMMVFGMFMAILDIQIVSSSMTEIQAGLSASSDEINWVQTAYLIAEVIMIPFSGFLNRMLSTRVLFSISALGFTLSSALCATATSINQMIIYRAFQGFIGGGMIPTVFATAFTIFSPQKRRIVTPIIGLVVTLAPTIGPTVGGYLSSSFSWHWLFLINVPIGILVTTVSWLTINFDEGDISLLQKLDWLGLASMALFLGSLEYVLEEGPQHDWLSDQTILIMTICMVVGAILFFYQAFTRKEPIVDLYAFSNLNFALGTFFSFSLGIGLYGLTFMYPLYLGHVLHYSSYDIGTTMFVSGVSMFIGAPLAAILSSKMDERYVMAIGFLGFALCTYNSSSINTQWGFWELFDPQMLRGISMMLCMVPINNITLGTLSPDRLKGASSLFNLSRNLGGAIGLGIINTILINRTAFHYSRLSDSLNWQNRSAIDTIQALSYNFSHQGLNGQAIAMTQIATMVNNQATVLSLSDCFILISILFMLLSLLVLFVKKPNR